MIKSYMICNELFITILIFYFNWIHIVFELYSLNNEFRIYSEIMHAMWKPQKFKYIYLIATVYVFTLTLPSASTVYWAFGDELLNHSNAFSLLPKTRWRDAAVILMLIHQVNFGGILWSFFILLHLSLILVFILNNFTQENWTKDVLPWCSL